VKAAVVREFGHPPSYGEFDDPLVRPGETVVSASASAVTPLAIGRASGTHYSSDTKPPFVPGVDGVGTTPDGRRVYFSFIRPPYGSLAERVPVRAGFMAPVPDGLNDASAAAAAISGMSCWVPLTRRARVVSGESVLVNGATGAAGRMAVQVAKHLGAQRVIATGRNEAKLRALTELGADVVVPLGDLGDPFRETIRREAAESKVGVVLDYLWGRSAEVLVDILGGPDGPRGTSLVRFVHIGSMMGPTASIPGAKLRSSGLEILGTGLGSTPNPEIVVAIGEFLGACAASHFRVDADVHPLSEVGTLWTPAVDDKRVVFSIP